MKHVSCCKIGEIVGSSNAIEHHWHLRNPIHYFSGHNVCIYTRKIRIQNEQVDPDSAIKKPQKRFSVFGQSDIVSTSRQFSLEKAPDMRISIGDEDLVNLFHCLSFTESMGSAFRRFASPAVVSRRRKHLFFQSTGQKRNYFEETSIVSLIPLETTMPSSMMKKRKAKAASVGI